MAAYKILHSHKVVVFGLQSLYIRQIHPSNLDIRSMVGKPTIHSGYGICLPGICSGRPFLPSSEAEGMHAKTHRIL